MNFGIRIKKSLLYILAIAISCGFETPARADEKDMVKFGIIVVATAYTGSLFLREYALNQRIKPGTFKKDLNQDWEDLKKLKLPTTIGSKIVGRSFNDGKFVVKKTVNAPIEGFKWMWRNPVKTGLMLGAVGVALHPEGKELAQEMGNAAAKVANTAFVVGPRVSYNVVEGLIKDVPGLADFHKNFGIKIREAEPYLYAATLVNTGATLYKTLKGDKDKDKKEDNGREPVVTRYTQGSNDVWFKDIIGIKEDKGKQEIIRLLSSKTSKVRGIVMTGPGGVGKTQLLAALCNELDFGFVILDANRVITEMQGSANKNVAAAFREARTMSKERGGRPTILCIDEIDVIGCQRPDNNEHGIKAEVHACNTLLTELDGLKNLNKDVIVIATTNRYQVLDKALIRPGRLSIKVDIHPLSDQKTIKDTFIHYVDMEVRNRNLDEQKFKGFGMMINKLSIKSVTPADIKEGVNLAFEAHDNPTAETISRYILRKYSESPKIERKEGNANNKKLQRTRSFNGLLALQTKVPVANKEELALSEDDKKLIPNLELFKQNSREAQETILNNLRSKVGQDKINNSIIEKEKQSRNGLLAFFWNWGKKEEKTKETREQNKNDGKEEEN